MKIAICHTDFRVYWPLRIAALSAFLRKKGADLHVVEIAGKGSPYAFAGKSNHNNAPCSWICLFPESRMEDINAKVASARLYEALENLQPDIIIAGAIAYPSGATAVRWCRERKTPVIIMDNARLNDVPRSALVNWVKRRIYDNVDAIFIPAKSHVSDYKYWGINEARMFFGLNIVDNAFFTARADVARAQAAVIREKFGLSEYFFLGIGRQIPKKNWDILIKAFNKTLREVNNEQWGLVLVGDGPETPWLKEIAAESNGKIIFLPFQDQVSLCQFYGSAACFVLPSSYGETWGLVVNEAMACHLPVMVSRECGCAETLVRDGFNGWQFEPHNVEQLSALMDKFINLAEEERKQMGKNSFQIIKEWGLDRFCEGIWQAVQFCMKKPARGYAAPVIDRIILNRWKGRYRPV